MPIFLNRTDTKRMPRGKRRGRPMRPSRRITLEVRRAITDSMKGLIEDIENLTPWLEGTATAAEAAQVLRDIRERWRVIFGVRAQRIAEEWQERISRESREQLERNIADALGLDMTRIFDEPIVRDAAELMSMEARALITSIQDDYLDKVQQAVTQNFMQLPLPEGKSLAEYISDLSGLPDSRARLISRDQTRKMHTAIDQARQQSIGIEEYIWRTRKDGRVVGKPGGMYPEGNAVHGNHWKREGKTFRWDAPPPDGHPGYAINCRCFYEPIIDVSKLRNAA